MWWLEQQLVETLRIGGALVVAVGVLIVLALAARRDRRQSATEPDARLSLAPALDQTQQLPAVGRHRRPVRCPAPQVARQPRRVSAVYRSVGSGCRG